MAAASLSGRGAAGVRGTKGLFCFFTLLGLVCLASSMISREQLEEIKQDLQKSQQKLDMLKARRDTISESMDYYMSFVDPLIAFAKQTSEDLPDDFPPVGRLLETFKGYMEKSKTYVDRQNVELDEKIEYIEQKVRETEENIKLLEKHHAEL